MAEDKVQNYGNPYPVEDMLIRFENGLAAEVSRAVHECSIKQTESYNIYGSKKSFMYEGQFCKNTVYLERVMPYFAFVDTNAVLVRKIDKV